MPFSGQILQIFKTTCMAIICSFFCYTAWSAGLLYYEIWDQSRTSMQQLPSTIRDHELKAVMLDKMKRKKMYRLIDNVEARNIRGTGRAWIDFRLPLNIGPTTIYEIPLTIELEHNLGGVNWRGDKHSVPKHRRHWDRKFKQYKLVN